MITLSDNKIWLMNGFQGKAHEAQQDMVLEATWGRNGSDKVAYIYDYFHDDQPELAVGMTYSQYTTKTKIDIRYNMTANASLAKDQNESHIMFRPSVERKLSNTWPLDYYPTSFGKNAEFPIGIYIDIPDNRNVYRKWLICDRTYSESYVYYLILPCNYRYTWVKDDKLYQMWGVARIQNSYNSGNWRANITTIVENQDLGWLPNNKYVQTIFYDTRFAISDDMPEPIVWKCSKVSTVHPFGLYKLTFYQDRFNADTDELVDGLWYCDYNRQNITKEPKTEVTRIVRITPSSGKYDIRSGPYDKVLTATIIEDGVDLTDKAHTYGWQCYIGDENITGELTPSYDDNKVTLHMESYDYIGETLRVEVLVDGKDSASIELEVIA